MKPFEKSLRLLLELHSAMRIGNDDLADEIRDQLVILYGWHGGMHLSSEELSKSEKELWALVSDALYKSELK